MQLKIKLVHPKAKVPTRGTDGSLGFDLYACESAFIQSGKRAIVDIGIAVEFPQGTGGFVCSRSGLAAKNGVAVLNSPGIIDADYTGCLKAILINHGDNPFTVEVGDRVAQLVLADFIKCHTVIIDQLSETQRGEGGFGSTGVK